MWSRARARRLARSRVRERATRGRARRTNLVASTSDGDDRSVASARDRRDRPAEDDGVGGRFGAVVDAAAAPRRENDGERRRNAMTFDAGRARARGVRDGAVRGVVFR